MTFCSAPKTEEIHALLEFSIPVFNICPPAETVVNVHSNVLLGAYLIDLMTDKWIQNGQVGPKTISSVYPLFSTVRERTKKTTEKIQSRMVGPAITCCNNTAIAPRYLQRYK